MLKRIVWILVAALPMTVCLAQVPEHADLYRQAIVGIDKARPGMAADANPLVRVRVAWTVGGFDTPRAREVLDRLLVDMDVYVRAEAVKALARHPKNDTPERLAGFAADEQLPVRRAALAALRYCGTSAQSATYIKAMDSDDPLLRRLAVACLARYGSAEGDARLAEALNTADDMVRLRILRELAWVRDGRFADRIKPYLHHTRWDFRGLSLVILSGVQAMDDGTVSSMVQPALADPHPYVRRMALACLFAKRGEAALEHVVGMAGDDDAGVREAAMEMLGTVPDDKARATLRQHLDDDYQHVRVAASKGLAAVLNEAFADKLVKEDIAKPVAADATTEDRSFNRVNMAIRCLGVAQYTPADKALRGLFDKARNIAVKKSCLFAVAEMNRTDTEARSWRRADPQEAGVYLDAMVPRGGYRNYDIQETAIVGLAKLRYKPALPKLTAISMSQSLTEERLMVADMAVRAIESDDVSPIVEALPEQATGYPVLTPVWRPLRAKRPVAFDQESFWREVRDLVDIRLR